MNLSVVTMLIAPLQKVAIWMRVLLACVTFSLSIVSTNAWSEWRDDLGTFRIGMIGGDNPSGVVAKTEPFRLALQEALGMNVEIFPARDFSALIDAQASARIEYAILSATAYAATWNLCECIEPLVVPMASDGTAEFRSILIARADGARSVEELAGKTILALSETSIGGHLFAANRLFADGYDLAAQGSIIKPAAAAEQAVKSFAAGEGEALIGWSSLSGSLSDGYSRGTLRDLIRVGPAGIDGYSVIWQSVPVPHKVHAIRKNLDADAKRILRDLLVNLFNADPVAYDSIEAMHGGGFVAARQAQFQSMVEFARNPFVVNPDQAATTSEPPTAQPDPQ